MTPIQEDMSTAIADLKEAISLLTNSVAMTLSISDDVILNLNVHLLQAEAMLEASFKINPPEKTDAVQLSLFGPSKC